MSIGDDGFIQSSVNGPDITLRMPGLPSKSLYDKYMNYFKGTLTLIKQIPRAITLYLLH